MSVCWISSGRRCTTGRCYKAFNVGGDRSVTVLELESLVADAIGVDLEPRISGVYRVGDTRHIRSDVSRLKAYGWCVQEELSGVVRHYLDWALASPDFHNAASEAQARMRRLGVLKQATLGARGAAADAVRSASP